MNHRSKCVRFLLFFFTFCLVSACKTKNTINSNNNTTVLVQLFDDSEVVTLENTYKNYGLQKQKVVSRPMSIYLFNFNSDKIVDTTLIKLLKQSPLVKEAQKNGNVQQRKIK